SSSTNDGAASNDVGSGSATGAGSVVSDPGSSTVGAAGSKVDPRAGPDSASGPSAGASAAPSSGVLAGAASAGASPSSTNLASDSSFTRRATGSSPSESRSPRAATVVPLPTATMAFHRSRSIVTSSSGRSAASATHAALEG